MHGFGNLVFVAVIGFFIVANLWKRFSTATARAAAAVQPPAVPLVTAPAAGTPAAANAALPARRRLAPASVPVLPPRPAPGAAPLPPARLPIPPNPDAFPAEAAAAFAGLDLSLPIDGLPGAPVRRPRRTIGSAAVLGSRGWGAGAIVAMEVLGPPVAVRPGATLGASHAL